MLSLPRLVVESGGIDQGSTTSHSEGQHQGHIPLDGALVSTFTVNLAALMGSHDAGETKFGGESEGPSWERRGRMHIHRKTSLRRNWERRVSLSKTTGWRRARRTLKLNQWLNTGCIAAVSAVQSRPRVPTQQLI